MRTRGSLEVDQSSREVTTFICTNTMVEEAEGRELIKQMKKKFMMLVNSNENPPEIQENSAEEVSSHS